MNPRTDRPGTAIRANPSVGFVVSSVGTLALGCLAAPSPAAVEAGRITIEAREAWGDVFGGSKVEFHLAVNSAEPTRGLLQWSFSVERGTLARGEAEITAGPGGTASVDLQFEVPPVKEGVILPALLSASVFEAGGPRPVATLEKPVWVFPRDPFADRSAWLKGLQITLYDPAGATAAAFEKLSIPFERARNVAAIAGLSGGMLVVGEGASFAEDRDLPEVMARVAAAGRPVLCLAPSGGVLPIPGLGEPPPPAPRRLAFRRQDVIAELDKRLDAVAWPADGRVVASSLVLRGEGAAIVAEVSPDGRGWPWVEADFPAEGGKLLVCGFALVAHYDEGPAPRFLLARLFERMQGAPGPQPPPNTP